MVQPFDYSLNIQRPDQALASGFNMGAQMRQARMQQEQQQSAAQEKAVLQEAMQAFGAARTPAEKVAVMEKYPAFAKPISDAWNNFDEAVKKPVYDAGLQGYAALIGGNPKLAASSWRTTGNAFANSNRPDLAQTFIRLADIAEENPQAADLMASSFLSVAGGKQFKEFGETIKAKAEGDKAVTEAGAAAEQRPFETSAKRAAATTAEAKANVAAPMAALELEKAGWDIQALQNDMQIKRQNAQIAAMNAAIGREGNDLKRQELQLKVAELNDKVSTRINERAAEGKQAQAQADILLQTADKAIKSAAVVDPKTGKITGFTGTVRSATGPIESRLPTLSQDVADFEAMIETLGSQIAMSRIGEMKGALSDKDLETLRASMASLSLRQSPAALVSNLQNIQRLAGKAKQVTAERYGAPTNAAPARRLYNPATGRIE